MPGGTSESLQLQSLSSNGEAVNTLTGILFGWEPTCAYRRLRSGGESSMLPMDVSGARGSGEPALTKLMNRPEGRSVQSIHISGVRTICSRQYFCDTESWPQSGCNILAT